jgi:ankyrin repeat protein
LKNNHTLVKHLLASGVSPSTLFRTNSLLCWASIRGYTDVVRELLDAGADITAKTKGGDGLTALQLAAKHKHRDVVALLLAKAKELKNANK